MIKRTIGIIVILFLQFNIVFAQNSFEIEGVYSYTSENLVRTNDRSQIYYPQRLHSFGINGKKILKSNIFIQSGLHLNHFGTTVFTEHALIDVISSDIKGQSIDIPINVGYYFLNRDKIRLGMSLGITNGFVLSQHHSHNGVTIAATPIYNDFIFQLNSSVEIGVKLTNNIILNVKPIFHRQINSNNIDYKQGGIGGQFGVSYAFTGK